MTSMTCTSGLLTIFISQSTWQVPALDGIMASGVAMGEEVALAFGLPLDPQNEGEKGGVGCDPLPSQSCAKRCIMGCCGWDCAWN